MTFCKIIYNYLRCSVCVVGPVLHLKTETNIYQVLLFSSGPADVKITIFNVFMNCNREFVICSIVDTHYILNVKLLFYKDELQLVNGKSIL